MSSTSTRNHRTPTDCPFEDLATLRALLAGAGLPLCDGPENDQKLTELRALYEPYVNTWASS